MCFIACICSEVSTSYAYRVFVVRCMLYGFGDDEQPYAETVDLLEDLVIEYISETVSKTKTF